MVTVSYSVLYRIIVVTVSYSVLYRIIVVTVSYSVLYRIIVVTVSYSVLYLQDHSDYQVGEMKRNKIQLHLIGRIMIPIRLCSLPLHSPCICFL